jgi:ABC-2 type transport system permease protein
MFFAGNNGHISRIVGRGQMEHMFIQPLPIPLQLITMGFFPFTGSGELFCGGFIIAAAVKYLGITLPWWWFLSLAFQLLITIVIIVAQSYLYASAAFYAPVAAEEISTLVIDEAGSLGNYPLSGQARLLQLPLLTLFPTGLLGWFPSQALLGKSPLGLPAFFPLLIAACFVLAAQYLFRKGLKHYVKTGSNRYLPRGHRR